MIDNADIFKYNLFKNLKKALPIDENKIKDSIANLDNFSLLRLINKPVHLVIYSSKTLRTEILRDEKDIEIDNNLNKKFNNYKLDSIISYYRYGLTLTSIIISSIDSLFKIYKEYSSEEEYNSIIKAGYDAFSHILDAMKSFMKNNYNKINKEHILDLQNIYKNNKIDFKENPYILIPFILSKDY